MAAMDIEVSDNVVTLPGPPRVTVLLRRSARARRLNLRVSGLDGHVTLSIPRNLPQRKALEFLTEKEDWLRKALRRIPDQHQVAPGREIPLRGCPVRITEQPGLRRVIEGNAVLLVPQDASQTRTAARLANYLKASAQVELRAAAQHYAAQIQRPISAIALRDTRSRWGSCTAQGRLMFSWRLIMAPPEVLRYVAAHEVAHLRHMDHSPAFWACVAELMPDYAPHRAWLRRHGATLHSYRFGTRPGAPAEDQPIA